jgi:hypothetical protein
MMTGPFHPAVTRATTFFLVTAALYACDTGSNFVPNDAMDIVRNDAADATAADRPGDSPADATADATNGDAWTVAPGCNPLAITNECVLPYPSDFLTTPDSTTPTGLRYAMPPNSLHVPPGRVAIDMTPFNRADGAPTSAPILVHFGVDIAATFLADDTQTALLSHPTAPSRSSMPPRAPAFRSSRRWTQTRRTSPRATR